MHAKLFLVFTMILVLVASHYAYGEKLISSNAKKLNAIINDLDSKISEFNSTHRTPKSDTVAVIKQYKNDIIKIKKQFQTFNVERGSENFLSVTMFKKAIRSADLAADNAYCLVINKHLNEKTYADCSEKFTMNKNKALRLTARLA